MKREIYLIPGGGPGGDAEDTVSAMGMALGAIGKERPSIAYIGTASDDSRPFYAMFRKWIREAGAGDVRLVRLCGRKVDEGACRRDIEAADAVFISGGDVDVGMDRLVRSGFDRVLREYYEGGKFFFGVSAGVIMMGEHWAHWGVEGDDSTASLIDCLGFADRTFDTHCEGEGWKELKCVLRLMGDGSMGYGLPSGGVFVYRPDGGFVGVRGEPDAFRNEGGEIVDA